MKTFVHLMLATGLFLFENAVAQISPNAGLVTTNVATFTGSTLTPGQSNIMHAYILDAGTNTFNDAMLDVFFMNEINSFASSIKDISLEINFLSISTESKTLTIGRNLPLTRLSNRPDKELVGLHDFFTVSVTAGVEKGFSKVYYQKTDNAEYNFASEISANIKYVHVGNGIISFTPADDAAIAAYRSSIDGKLMHDLSHDYIPAASTAAQLTQKYYEYYKKIADKEIANIKSQKLYSWYIDWWCGFDLNLPVTSKEINHKPDATAGAFEKKEFRSWKGTVFGNGLIHFPSFVNGTTINLRGAASYFNTNTFITSNASPKTFQSITSENGSVQVLAPADLVFIGPYDEFNNALAQAELSTLFLNSTIGVSGSADFNFGDYKARNWKLGIPVSLKDKDKKPLVNFEVQWREVNGLHVVGVSVGYAFGKFSK